MIKNLPAVPDDAFLISGIKKGDQHSLSKLYDKYAPAINGIICKIVAEEAIAEEILQKTFHAAWKTIRSSAFSQTSVFTALLHMARRMATDHVKVQQQQNHAPHNSVYAAAEKDIAQNGFSTTYQKPIFELLYFSGLCCEEVAATLKIPVETVKMHFRSSIKNIGITNIL